MKVESHVSAFCELSPLNFSIFKIDDILKMFVEGWKALPEEVAGVDVVGVVCDVVTDDTVVDDSTAVCGNVDVGGRVTEVSQAVERGAVTGTDCCCSLLKLMRLNVCRMIYSLGLYLRCTKLDESVRNVLFIIKFGNGWCVFKLNVR